MKYFLKASRSGRIGSPPRFIMPRCGNKKSRKLKKMTIKCTRQSEKC